MKLISNNFYIYKINFKMINNKIKSLKDIKSISTKLKNKNKKIILCHGVFDLIHNDLY